LQVRIAKEETKFGLEFSEIESILQSKELAELENIKIAGLMGMASFSSNEEEVSAEFQGLKNLYDGINQTGIGLEILSMGMSGDYKIAIKNGSNMIRVGSAIFGSRNYIA